MSRRTSSARSVLIVACLLAGAPADALAKWTQLRTEHFLFIGDAPEGRIRATAEGLERFREALSSILPPGAALSGTPTVVVVFGSASAFNPFRPQFEGRAIQQIGGYFQPGTTVNYIALNAENREAAQKIVFHEYAHFLVGNVNGPVPVWINEGLAELYETFQERDGGRSAIVGLAPGNHVLLLRNQPLIPLAQLMAYDESSPEYNEGNRRGVLYAESWALMHYMTLANQTRAAQVRDYLARLQAGASAEQAFADVFAADVPAIERELQLYVRRLTFPGLTIRFGDRTGRNGAGRGTPLDDLEAESYLGDLLAHIRRPADARVRLRAVLDKDPRRARAIAALGNIEVDADRLDEGFRLIEQAASLAPDDASIQAAFGDVLVRRGERERNEGAAYRDTLARARTVLVHALELAPQAPNVMAALGFVELVGGTDLNRAGILLRDAARLAPRREDYRLLLADVLILQRDYAQATALLGQLAARARQPQIRDAARAKLANVADRLASAATTLPAPPRPPVPSPGPDVPSIAGGNAPRGTAGSRPATGLRQPIDGEVRVMGIFQAIECPRGAIVLLVQTDTATLRLRAAAFADVNFISYLTVGPTAVRCGAMQPPGRVVATYRPMPGSEPPSDGVVVAVELVPDDFNPRLAP